MSRAVGPGPAVHPALYNRATKEGCRKSDAALVRLDIKRRLRAADQPIPASLYPQGHEPLGIAETPPTCSCCAAWWHRVRRIEVAS